MAKKIRTWILRILAAGIAVYGVFAFVKRDIGSYMLLRNEFVFFDYEEQLILFFIDFIAIMGLFVCIGYYVTKGLKQCIKRKK